MKTPTPLKGWTILETFVGRCGDTITLQTNGRKIQALAGTFGMKTKFSSRPSWNWVGLASAPISQESWVRKEMGKALA
jgi:hypothetical protein